MPLRDYQQEAVDTAFKYWDAGNKRPCVIQLATGGGKSIILAEITRRLKAPVLLLQPTKEILEQNYEKLVNEAGMSPSQLAVCSASAGSWKIGDITLATIGTIAKWSDYCQHFAAVLIDECDVCPVDRASSQYMKFLNELPKGIKVLGLTASPWRNQVFTAMYEDPKVFCRPITRIHCDGGKGTNMGEWVWNKIIYRCGIATLQKRGYLSPTEYYMAETDWSFVNDVPGRVDYDTNAMGAKWMDIEANSSRFSQAVDWCMQNKLKTIIFTPNIDMNFRLRNIVLAMGGKAECMDSDHDDKKTREAKMEQFRRGDFQFLINVGMVGRGVDVPSVDCVLLCRPTKSLSVYMQAVGRCLRLDPTNPNKIAYILDLAGNVERFGKVEDVLLGSIDKVAANGWKYKQDVITVVKDGKRKIWDRVS